ncbi:MAG: hypothetical protein ACK5WR_17230 [Planctomycetaceae bacterium]|jgi:hypothetical protein
MKPLPRDIWERNQIDPTAIPDTVLYSRLADTIEWCRRILDDQTIGPSMRTHMIAPRIFHDGRDDVVCDVGSSRHWQIRATTTIPAISMPNLNGGRLLCYFPDDTLSDGAAEHVSDGFFDYFNTPPWDTWVGYFEDRETRYDNYLLSYVPERLVALAEGGILVNPERCILWLEDTNVKLKSRFLSS